MNSIELLKKTLKENGFALTAPRVATLNALNTEEPQSMHELIRRVGNRADRASIYRTISIFERLHIVERLAIGWKYKLELSDRFAPHHHHLTCMGCGDIIAVHENTHLEKEIKVLAESSSFQATSHSLEIRGYCRKCQNQIIG